MFSPSFLVALALAMFVTAADFYQILEVPKSASQKDIQKAYRRLCVQFHPDKNRSPGASKKYMECSTAYEVLSNAQTRQAYDRYGEAGLKARDGGQHQEDPFDNLSSFSDEHYQQQVRRGLPPLAEYEVLIPDIYKRASIDHYTLEITPGMPEAREAVFEGEADESFFMGSTAMGWDEFDV